MSKTSDIPVIPPLTPEQKRQRDDFDPNPPLAKCGECGITIHRVMGFSCQNRHCPAGLGPRGTL